ncbi:MAG TPA: VOC family protein [Caulobacter sp.]|nr:VOC family protein [Caulobacter sp.]
MTDQAPPTKGVIPYLNVVGAAEAADLYRAAFGAIEHRRMPADDGKRLMHCHLEINGGSLMLSDCFPESGYEHQPSHSFTMQLVVDDIDAWFQRAVDAGLTVTNPVTLMFWGDRWGSLTDRFGVHWAMNQPTEQA